MASNRVGSVFLGDIQQRHRHLSSSTHSSPPSSPPSTSIAAGVFAFSSSPPPTLATASEEIDSIDMDSFTGANKQPTSINDTNDKIFPSSPGKVDPVLALELRLRWLEALVLGMKQDTGKDRKGKAREFEYVGVSASAAANLKHGETLTRLTETVQARLDKAIEGNEGLKRFMDSYGQNAHLLTPSFALSGILPDPPTFENMTPEEINALLGEMEPDIRAADRDLTEIDTLEKKGVLGAGHLPDYEQLEPRLKALVGAYDENSKLAASLEIRIAALVERHATYVDSLSELFVAWDDILTEAEDRTTRMERDRAERLRMGLE